MRTIRVKAGDIVKDIRAGLGDTALMEKYRLSVRSLLKVLIALLDKGLITREELGSFDTPPPNQAGSIKVSEFLASFRRNPDDFYLMEKYSLRPQQLKRIYDALVEKRLLSEYEYNYRERKAPELEEPVTAESEDSTAVDLSGEVSESLRRELITPGLSENIVPSEQPESGPRRTTEARLCPNCRKPVDASSPDTCVHCGIVFAKYREQGKYKGVAIWDPPLNRK